MPVQVTELVKISVWHKEPCLSFSYVFTIKVFLQIYEIIMEMRFILVYKTYIVRYLLTILSLYLDRSSALLF